MARRKTHRERVAQTVRHRVPNDAPEEVKQIADRALQRIVDVMEEKVDHQMAPSVLKAAALARDEICGPIPKDLHVQGTMTLEQLVRAAVEPPKAE